MSAALEEEGPDVLGSVNTDGVWSWQRDDAARVVRYADGTTRSYDEAENVAADTRAMKSQVDEILADLNSYADRAQQIIDTPNPTINASPAAYIKDGARAMKRTISSVKDLIRMMK